MITFRRFREALELAACGPVELSGVDHDAPDGRTVATNPFGGTVDDDIGAQRDGTDDVATCAPVRRGYNGRTPYSPAPKVLSTMRGMPLS